MFIGVDFQFDAKEAIDYLDYLARFEWVKPQLKELAEAIAERARELVPVDTGALRNSIRVEERDNGYAVVAGGPEAPYAIYVHERLDLHHEVGQAKFIEVAAMELVDQFKLEVPDA